MGQANKRGTREQRVNQAEERREMLRPDKLVCNNCQTEFTEFEMFDTRGVQGIEMACAGSCPNCKEVTWGLKGEPEACQEFAEMIMQDKGMIGDQAKFGTQNLRDA